MDIWVQSGPRIITAEEPSDQATFVRLLALILGIVLTWLLYVVVARLLIWRLAATGDE